MLQQVKPSLAVTYGLPEFVPVVAAVPAALDSRGGITYILPPTEQLEATGLDGYIPAGALKPLLNHFGHFLLTNTLGDDQPSKGGDR